jgi:DNA helicase-2/ATP-dependent DNA helicase PcrA
VERRFYEYRGMRGGEHYERMEANPMIGYRGCFRNVAESDLFGIELAAITHVWESGLSNLHLMIYNTISEDGYDPWIVAEKHLEISQTNRYGDEIARVLTQLRTGKITIVSTRGLMNRKPVLLVYSKGMENKVVDAFVGEIRKAGLPIDGTYKAIGMVRRGSGITITDYWRSFEDDGSLATEGGWEFYRQEIVDQLQKHQLYGVAKMIVEILVLVSRCCNVRTENGKLYTKTQMRRKINEKANNEFRSGIMNLAEKFVKDPQDVEQASLVYLCQLCKLVFNHRWNMRQLATIISYDAEERESCPKTLDQCYDDGIKVQLNTVHGVKGETHDATLYLETEHRRGSDLKRIMPLFEGKDFLDEGVYASSRRCAYVGMSRPRDLLCVAMRETTYKGHESTFEDNWAVVHIQ